MNQNLPSKKPPLVNDRTPCVDSQEVARALRQNSTLTAGHTQKGTLDRKQVNFVAHNFPILLPHGSASLHKLFDPLNIASSPFELSTWQERFFFRDAPSATAVTSINLGLSAVILASGPGRFDEIRQHGERLLSQILVLNHQALSRRPASELAPRLYGGLSFAPGSADSGPWRLAGNKGFPDARFVLPKITIRCQDTSGSRHGSKQDRAPQQAVLTVFSTLQNQAGSAINDRELTVLIDAVHQIFKLVQEPLPSSAPVRAKTLDRCPGVCGDFLSRVERKIDLGLAAIESASSSGNSDVPALEKVVVAHHHELELNSSLNIAPGGTRSAGLDPAELLSRLEEVAEGGSIFALATAGALFLGAPPERLIAAHEGTIATEAVAGSRPRGHLTSFNATDKDQREHRVVVEHILRALSPLCTAIEATAEPLVRAHAALLHLETPISGRLATKVHVLDLAARLHPTPAVCGAPQEQALVALRQIESQPRGWYAGPVGWFDGSGNGEFAVALRSALLIGSQARLYAGAGVVAGSIPSKEAQEIADKMVTMSRVLAPYLEQNLRPQQPTAPAEPSAPNRWLALAGLMGMLP